MDEISVNLALRYTDVSIALELFCAAVCAILAGHLLLGGSRKTRRSRLLARILILHVVTLVCDAAAWAFNGVLQPDLRILIKAANYLEFVLGYANFIFLTDYIVGIISEKRAVSRRVVHLVAAVCTICIVITTISLSNGIVFYIDERNLYSIGPWYNAMNSVVPAIIIFLSAVSLYYSRYLGRSDTLTFLSYIVFLFIAAILQLAFPGLMIYYATYTLSILITYVNVHVQHEKLLQEKELELADARISIMISQIQPHFLYNTLSVVGDLCRHDPVSARETVIDFSRYLRANLAALTEKETIFFEEEMEHVDTYLSLETKRFGDKIRIVREIGAANFPLPPLTLQPIVENAVLHGITAREEGGTVVIKTEEDEGAWRISVIDDGVGFDTAEPQDARFHVGIRNVRFRLDAMSGGRLDVASTPGKGTEAVITIPKRGLPVGDNPH